MLVKRLARWSGITVLGKKREIFKDGWPNKMWFKVGSTDWVSSI